MPSMTARITKIEHDLGSGFYRISTDGDPKRLDTKIREKAEEAARLSKTGNPLLIEFTENPRTDPATGRTYRNAYYERASEAGPASSDDLGIETVGTVQRRTDPNDAWRMTLGAACKLAVSTIGNLPEASRTKEVVLDFGLQQNIALAWARLIFFSTPPDPSTTSFVIPGNGGFRSPEDAPSETPPHSDEDFPF